MPKKRKFRQVTGIITQRPLRDVILDGECDDCNMISRIVGFELDGRRILIKETCEKILDEVDGKVIFEQDYRTVYCFKDK